MKKNPFQRLKTAGEGPVLTDNDNMVERKLWEQKQDRLTD